MPPKVTPGAARIASASRRASSGSSTPHRSWPTLQSTSSSISAPALAAVSDTAATLPRSSTQRDSLAPPAAMAARREILGGLTSSLLSRMSVTPPSTMASTSASFWQQTPVAPRSSICSLAISAHLWALQCGRMLTVGYASILCLRLRQLASRASRSTSSAGVSTSATSAPTKAGGLSADSEAQRTACCSLWGRDSSAPFQGGGPAAGATAVPRLPHSRAAPADRKRAMIASAPRRLLDGRDEDESLNGGAYSPCP
mmetsp:Transcript_10771/g.27303  ORF Transcript_10771/g.27303 Transcript_10771/m.27303 type:complete len:256 (-) Transcript_10771:76-843(-)